MTTPKNSVSTLISKLAGIARSANKLSLLFSACMLINLQLFASDTTSTTKQIVAWNGEETNKGSGWTNPERSCTIGQQTFESHSGKTALEFKFKGASGIWLGAGWDWAVMRVGPYGIDITDMTYFTFWLKVKGKTSEFSLNLLCNGEPVLDQPQHHTEKVIISSYCPDWRDGEWHQIIIPLKDLVRPEGFDSKYVAEIQMFNTGNGDGSFFIDDIAFNNQEIEMLKNGNFSDCDSNWVVDQTKEAKGQIEYVKDGPDGKTALRLTVISISDAPWRLQIYQKGMRIEKGKNYQMSFWVKSDRIGDFTVNCMQNHEPWAHPTQQKMSVSTEWKQIQFIFVGAWNDDNTRITFTNLGTIPGQVYWFANCSLKQTTVNARQN